MSKVQVYSSKTNNNSTTPMEVKEKITPTYISQKLIQELEKEARNIKCGFWGGIDCFPRAVKFENQENEEQIILFLRQHIIVNVQWILLFFVLLFLPMFFSGLNFFSFMPANFVFFTYVLWYLFVIVFVIEKVLSWLYNTYIITDERVIDIDFYSLVYKRISECKIDKIEDVTYEQGGLFQSFFDYGNILIQTAAEQKEFDLLNVPQPSRVAKVLNQLIMQEEQEKIEGRIR